jgi:cellulose synthase/poly-beta-1,6-N-acetylglucosamine synthase-like glycosyltransferase
MIHIITPCHRPKNLNEIRKSIPKECNWIIVFDAIVENPPKIDGAICLESGKTGDFGAHNRNFALDTYQFAPDDWIAFLDSDNIMHPEWIESVKPHLDKDIAMLTWGQLNKDESVRLVPVDVPKVCEIDSASFMVKWKHVRDIRWSRNYTHDGEYAEDCATRGRVLALNKYIAYYNYID